MNILHLTTHLNIGGIGRYVTNLSKVLKRRGHSVFVASSGGELERDLSDKGIRHIRLGIRTKSELSPKVAKSFFDLRHFLKKENIDLIHAHTRVTQVVAALLGFYQKVPYVTTCHGFFRRRLGRRIFGCWGRKVVAISEAVKRQLIDDFGVEEDRIALIHTGVDIALFAESIPQEEKVKIRNQWNLGGSPAVGMIGRLSPVKGQEVLVRAAQKLVGYFSDIKILLIGDGPDRERLEKLTEALRLKENVIFTGSAEDTRKILSIMDVFVQPSMKEGLGLSLVEAMASGRPCVASRVGGIESLIEDGVTGLLVKPGDPDDLACAVKYILGNKDKVDKFRLEAKNRAIRDFDIDKMVLRVEKMYEDVVSS